MIYIKLIIDFFMVGILSFGGAYAAIPLIKDVAAHYDVITDELLVDFIAISESTPGPVAVNLATFVGTEVAGIPGAIVATLAEILPAFIIILIFTICFSDMLKNKNVEYALSIIRPSIMGLIMAVGVSLYYRQLVPNLIKYIDLSKYMKPISEKLAIDIPVDVNFNALIYEQYGYFIYIFKLLVITILIFVSVILYKRVFKEKMSAIKIIILGVILGILLGGYGEKGLEYLAELAKY